MIEKLNPVSLREIWKLEAKDFTKWLSDNLDILNEQIGSSLSLIETEKKVGVFHVDILARDKSGHVAIIENQLEKTDHDHLGKVLTYLANVDAKIGIWISSDPRPEHATAINYLNETAPEDTEFFLIKLQAFKIGDSPPAPLFSIISGPNPEVAAGGKIKKDLAENEKKRYEFFEQLLIKSNKKTNLFQSVSPVGYQGWLWAGGGKSGLSWVYGILMNKARTELFLGSSEGKLNKKWFDILFSNKNVIENEFGEPLSWEYKEGRKQHYIRSYSEHGGLQDVNIWAKIQDDLVDKMIRLEGVLSKYFSKF